MFSKSNIALGIVAWISRYRTKSLISDILTQELLFAEEFLQGETEKVIIGETAPLVHWCSKHVETSVKI